MNNDKPQYTYIVISDLDYEKMVIYLMLDDNHIATINCDENINYPQIEIFDHYSEHTAWKLDCNGFIGALEHARKKLKEVNEYE